MQVLISTIPHSLQRYPTVGDWVIANEAGRQVVIMVSEIPRDLARPGFTQPADGEFAVALHEFVETWLCMRDGVAQAAVEEFDLAFEAARLPGDFREPGDQPDAPYHKQHVLATKVERLVLEEGCGVDWDVYDAVLSEL